MPYYRRARVPGASYFFTVVSEGRRPILTDATIRAALRRAICEVRAEMPFRIDGWVLLPDHMHVIWTLPEGDADYSTRWKRIKGKVTHECGNAYLQPDYLSDRHRTEGSATLWQKRFWEHLLRNEGDFSRHLDYLHGNPLKHGLVDRVGDWPWSSFHRWLKQGEYPAAWAGGQDDLRRAE